MEIEVAVVELSIDVFQRASASATLSDDAQKGYSV
jgi:hypothetical protein